MQVSKDGGALVLHRRVRTQVGSVSVGPQHDKNQPTNHSGQVLNIGKFKHCNIDTELHISKGYNQIICSLGWVGGLWAVMGFQYYKKEPKIVSQFKAQ